MEKKLFNERPFVASINDDGSIYCSDNRHYSGMFYESELIAIKLAIEKTLQDYHDLGICDSYIIEQDKNLLKEYMERLSNLKVGKKSEYYVDDLYLILDTTTNSLKIGRSKDVKNRLKQLQTANSHELFLICSINGKGYMESELHSKFENIRQGGEWFFYSNDIIGEFEKLGGIINKQDSKDATSNINDLKEKFSNFVYLYKKMGGKVRGVDTEFKDFTKRHKDWEQVIPYLSLAVQRECKEREKAKFERRFFPEPKMLQTYLGKQRAWELYVTIGEDLTNSTYNPTCTHELNWNDHYNCYIYMGQTWLSMPENIFDGYSDDDRPNGAKLMLNSGRGTIVWDSATKKWNKQ